MGALLWKYTDISELNVKQLPGEWPGYIGTGKNKIKNARQLVK